MADESESQSIEIPQPLKIAKYSCEEAVTLEVAIRLYANCNFEKTATGENPKSAHQQAMDCINRAQEFTSVANKLIQKVLKAK